MRILPLQRLGWGLILVLLPSPAEAAHPFYQRLLREGSTALVQQDYAEAQRLLRLANFGLLNEPERLAEGLVQLAIAEAESGEKEGFRRTFSRILEIEESFSAYSKATLDSELKARFEGLLANHVPLQTLRSVQAFRPLVRQMDLARIDALPRNERRPALRELLAQDPQEIAPALMLAELELAAGDAAAATETLQRVLQVAPETPRAKCLLGLAHHGTGRCDLAVPWLASCAETSSDETYAAALLGCYASQEQWDSADGLLATLSPAVASERQIIRLSRRIAKEKRRQAKLQREAGAVSQEAEAALTLEAEEGSREGIDAPVDAAPENPPAVEPPSTSEPPLGKDPADTVELEAPATSDGAPTRGMASQETAPPRQEAPSRTRPTEPPPPIPESPSSEALGQLEEARRMLAKARLASDLTEAFELAKNVADRYPQASAAQHLVGEIAYRASQWKDSAEYFRRGGDPGDERPNLLFFMAVSYFENGDQEEAEKALRRVLPQLQKTPFVTEYTEKILGNETR